jgi:peptide/nickel transport system ATP-binding protein
VTAENAVTAADTPAAARTGDALLDVRGLSVVYADSERPVRAVTDVSFTLRRGEVLGIAGESGSGKSTMLTALARLDRPPAVTTAGEVIFAPRDTEPFDLLKAHRHDLRKTRWEHLAVVMQSAMNALNPVLRLSDQFTDVIREHTGMRKAEAVKRAAELLSLVGIPADRLPAYPHELSGGMRQRATIALALALGPDLVLMDEPTTAVDVVMQRQIIRQVLRLSAELGFAVVFVTHDLSLLIEVADRIAVMYAGRIVELADAREVYKNPLHPYSEGLRDSFPSLRGPRRVLSGVPGSPPDLRALPPGCAFEPRCARRLSECATVRPELIRIGDRQVACLLHRGAS